MARARNLVQLAVGLALVVLVLFSLCAAPGDARVGGGAGRRSHHLRRPRYHYESDYLYIADAYMGPIRVGPGGYLHMRRQCTPWALTVCPMASRMELSLIRE